ncbi:MAG: hypothetical protein IPK05_03125 [Comamonadaceae bacterium]|nr:hypothetical protein [Comamonadaceae bacterium]
MTRKNRIFGLGLLVAAWGPQTLAQGNSAALTPNMTVNDPLPRRGFEVRADHRFHPPAQGNLAAAELKEKLLPAKTENDILFKDGYCGLATYLREKKTGPGDATLFGSKQ